MSRVGAGPVLPRSAYAGLITRTIAFAVDAVLINLAALVGAAAVALVLTVVVLPGGLEPAAWAAAGVAYVAWSTTYLVTSWSTLGQTPGDRLMGIRVCAKDGGRLGVGRSLLRVLVLPLAALPLFAGFLMILVDGRRRGLHDVVAGSVVIDTYPIGADDEDLLAGGAGEPAPLPA